MNSKFLNLFFIALNFVVSSTDDLSIYIEPHIQCTRLQNGKNIHEDSFTELFSIDFSVDLKTNSYYETDKLYDSENIEISLLKFYRVILQDGKSLVPNDLISQVLIQSLKENSDNFITSINLGPVINSFGNFVKICLFVSIYNKSQDNATNESKKFLENCRKFFQTSSEEDLKNFAYKFKVTLQTKDKIISKREIYTKLFNVSIDSIPPKIQEVDALHYITTQ